LPQTHTDPHKLFRRATCPTKIIFPLRGKKEKKFKIYFYRELWKKNIST